MSEGEQPGRQNPDSSILLLQLRAFNTLLIGQVYGLISNELQASGAILETIGALITAQGNTFGKSGFELETTATKLHIESVLQELKDQGKWSKSNTLLQLKAYNILLSGNRLGLISNEMQIVGALLQAIGAIIVTYGNLLAVIGYQYEIIATRLEITAVLKELDSLESNPKESRNTGPSQHDIVQDKHKSELLQLEMLNLKIQHLQQSIKQQQGQIDTIQKTLEKYKGDM